MRGIGERAEGTNSRVPVLSPSPVLPTDTIFLGSSPPPTLPNCISLEECSSPTFPNLCCPALLSSCPAQESAAQASGVNFHEKILGTNSGRVRFCIMWLWGEI